VKYIFDFGANRGQNLNYYLRMADFVIAIEANPVLCKVIAETYKKEIAQGKLFIEQVAVSPVQQQKSDFFIHKSMHVLSTSSPPKNRMGSYTRISVKSKLASQIIYEYAKGLDPWYCKFDLEGLDHLILTELFSCGIRPKYISAEAHNLKSLSAITLVDEYSRFKTVSCKSVKTFSYLFNNEYNRFDHDSAGPFGEDIPGPWFNAEAIHTKLCLEGFGCKDVHATTFKGESKNRLGRLVWIRTLIRRFFRLTR